MDLQELLKMIDESHRCSYLKQVLNTLLDLIITVDTNYKHIDELVKLTYLFGTNTDDKDLQSIYTFCKAVADNTRANHYRDDKFDDVYIIKEQLEK